MTDKNKVATTSKNTAVAVPFSYGEDAGAGMAISLDDLKVPFLSLVQDDSKVRFPDEEKYVEGSEAGDMLNSATKVLTKVGDGLLLIPAVIRTTMIEYQPDRGGFVAEHEITSTAAIKAIANGNVNPDNGNDLVKTKTMFAIVVDEDLKPIDYVVVGFTSSKLGPWSEYWTKINTAKITKDIPIYANLISLTTRDVKNAKGRFKNYLMIPARTEQGKLATSVANASVVNSLIDPASEAYAAAKEFAGQVLAGKRTASREEGTEEGPSHF